jgi:sporulation protein YlmC with PRC-barrel domain
MIARFTLRVAIMTGLVTSAWTLAQAQQLPQSKDVRPIFERASVLRTFVVKNAKGEELGQVRDFLIDVQHGRVLYAAVGHGGTLGIGEKYVAVPLRAMRIEVSQDRPNDRYFVLDLDKSILDNNPGFNKQDWPNSPDPYFLNDTSATPDRLRARRATALISMPARSPKGEQLGTIRDLMINVGSEQVIYAALGHGGGILTTEKLFAVPWDALQVKTLTGRAADEGFIINVQNAALDANGGFDNNHWPTEGDRSLFNNRRATP